MDFKSTDLSDKPKTFTSFLISIIKDIHKKICMVLKMGLLSSISLKQVGNKCR
jgi:hypothetical protein